MKQEEQEQQAMKASMVARAVSHVKVFFESIADRRESKSQSQSETKPGQSVDDPLLSDARVAHRTHFNVGRCGDQSTPALQVHLNRNGVTAGQRARRSFQNAQRSEETVALRLRVLDSIASIIVYVVYVLKVGARDPECA
jgi:hypothetical protein